MKKHRRKTLNILSLTLVLSLIVGLFASPMSMHKLSAEEAEATQEATQEAAQEAGQNDAQEAGQEFIISQDDMSHKIKFCLGRLGEFKIR